MTVDGRSASLMGWSNRISVITVVRDDARRVRRTIESVLSQPRDSVEYLIVDGNSTDGTAEIVREYSNELAWWTSEPDNGIYDAMNKAIEQATGCGLLFLNSGDYFVGRVLSGDSRAPSRLPVRFAGTSGRMRNARLKSPLFGLPYCHQGIIFPRTSLRYDCQYTLAADYEYYIRHRIARLPLVPADGYVWYDNGGISKQLASERDRQILRICRRRYGRLLSAPFYLLSRLKSIIRRLMAVVF